MISVRVRQCDISVRTDEVYRGASDLIEAPKQSGTKMRNRPTDVGRQLNRLFRSGTVGGMTDPQLLEQFVCGDDESVSLAFETIIERHGPMVLRVCRTVLRDVHTAEDAFQASFLVLARRARDLGARDLLGNWLYGVAARTARKARAVAARRQVRESQAVANRPTAVEILEDWLEITSWASQPRYGSKPAATYELRPRDGWKLFDITPLVRSPAKAGRKPHGAVFRFWSEDFSAATFSDYKMVSREGTSQWMHPRPMLLVVKGRP